MKLKLSRRRALLIVFVMCFVIQLSLFPKVLSAVLESKETLWEKSSNIPERLLFWFLLVPEGFIVITEVSSRDKDGKD